MYECRFILVYTSCDDIYNVHEWATYMPSLTFALLVDSFLCYSDLPVAPNPNTMVSLLYEVPIGDDITDEGIIQRCKCVQ
jgi:hypothetical protein